MAIVVALGLLVLGLVVVAFQVRPDGIGEPGPASPDFLKTRRGEPIASPDSNLSGPRAGRSGTSTTAQNDLTSEVSPPWPVRLVDVTGHTGIDFRHTDGGSGKFYIVESITAGLALFDYDLDGNLDVYFPNGAPLKGTHAEVTPTNAMYRNEGQWHFADVTATADVGDTGYGVGICVGDYNHDGFGDVYLNNFGENVLYRNNGDGTFSDVTHEAGVTDGHRVGAGANFFDADGDGDLDLYVAHYVDFSYETYKPHFLRGRLTYPGPLTLPPDPDTFYLNNGDGTFTDSSEASGIGDYAGTGMGTVCTDYDRDGDTDVFVGNDQVANFLFRNDGQGRFDEVGLLSGVALDAGGFPQATMGVDAGDFNNDGWPDLNATSYADEPATLYQNIGGRIYEDATRPARAGAGTIPHVTWGNGFADFDNDGDLDIFVACGHLDPNVDDAHATTSYQVRNVVLMNRSERFVNVSAASGNGLRQKLSSRGLALGDLDNDGDIDVVVSNSRDRPTLLRNDSSEKRNWIRVRVRGTTSNRGGVGARVSVIAGDLSQTAEVHSGRGYQSHFGNRLHFGLAERSEVDRVEVDWIGGGKDTVFNPRTRQLLTVIEGRGEKR